MTVADVPGSELALGTHRLPLGEPGLGILLGFQGPLPFGIVGSGVVCHDLREVGFVHVASMGQDGTEIKGPGPVPRLSHPVEHLSDRLTVLFFSLEDATVNGLRELTHLGRGGGIVTTLGVDLGDVGVGSGFVHVAIIGPPWTDLRPLVDSPPTVTSPSLLE